MQTIEMTITASLLQAQLGTVAAANIAKAYYSVVAGENARIDDRFSAAVELAVGEACTNSVRYCPASLAGTSRIQIIFEFKDSELVVRIKDSNPPFDFAGTPEPDFASLPEGGYGIHIMKNSMDQVDYRHEDGWNIVTMKKRIEPEN
jgi:serine/threonine-protein kinase RsbW